MNIISEIQHLFFANHITCSERLMVCEIRFECKAKRFPPFERIEQFLNLYTFSNLFKLQITNPDGTFELSSTNITLEKYNDMIQTFEEDDSLMVLISIDKIVTDHCLYVYCYKEFVQEIKNNGIMRLFEGLSGLFEKNCYITFCVLDKAINWHTNTILFTNNPDSSFNQLPNRESLIKERHSNSYFQCEGRINVLPEDFSIVVDCDNNVLNELFNKAKTLLSLSYISSGSTLDENKLVGVINGQRSLPYEVPINDLKDNDVIYKVYKWIYTDGNPIDKAIIARNIISLHCRYSSILEIDYKTLTSITSNYGFYLKDNVNHYLDAKSKVSEYISDIVARLGESALGITKSLTTNLVAMLSFFLTVVLTNLATGNSFENIFTDDILKLFEIILLGSFIYFILSLLSSIYKYKKIDYAYKALRNNYVDLLSEEELHEVFEKNGIYKKCLSDMIRSMVISSSAWVCLIMVLFIMVEVKKSHSAASCLLCVFKRLLFLFYSI